jgi:hypothetical protein
MENITLNHWEVERNKVSIALSHLNASFSVLKDGEYIYYQLEVNDRDMKKITMDFYTLEDVMGFIQNIVSKSRTNEEVLNKYNEMKENEQFRLPGGLKTPENDKIIVSPDEIKEAITDYYDVGKNYKVSVREDIYVDYNGHPQINYYLVEHYYNKNREFEYMLTETDIKKALANYIGKNGYDLNDFKYIGGVHKVGYFVDEDTVYFEGIELNVSEKENNHIKRKALTK